MTGFKSATFGFNIMHLTKDLSHKTNICSFMFVKNICFVKIKKQKNKKVVNQKILNPIGRASISIVSLRINFRLHSI